jgi:hypothetical protein
MRRLGGPLHLGFLEENQSEVRPDSIHADTQGKRSKHRYLWSGVSAGDPIDAADSPLERTQSVPPPGEASLSPHRLIDSLFSTQAEWDLIETMLPDMLRVALSIKAGTIMPSTILRRPAQCSATLASKLLSELAPALRRSDQLR